MIALLLVYSLSSPTAAQATASPAVSTAAAAASPLAPSTATVSSLYTGDRVRDPFMTASMGGGSSARKDEDKPEGPQPVDIHGLVLRGFMKDSAVDYALFSSESGGSYILKGGKLYDERNKVVPGGVTGRIRLKQKTVELMTPDKDVQIYRLGEDEKDKEKDKS